MADGPERVLGDGAEGDINHPDDTPEMAVKGQKTENTQGEKSQDEPASSPPAVQTGGGQ